MIKQEQQQELTGRDMIELVCAISAVCDEEADNYLSMEQAVMMQKRLWKMHDTLHRLIDKHVEYSDIRMR